MLGAVIVESSAPPFWPNFGWILAAVVPVVLVLAPFALKGFRNWRAERRLVKGIPGAPGIPELSPLGTRLSRQEAGLRDVGRTVDGHTSILQHHTGQLTEQSGQLDRIMAEVTPNGGGSLKDQAARADQNSARAADLAEQALDGISRLSQRLDNLTLSAKPVDEEEELDD